MATKPATETRMEAVIPPDAIAKTFETLSAKLKIDYTSGNNSMSFGGTLRMKKDSVIWLSLFGPFGIEGGRVLLTRDSFFMDNKLSGEKTRQPLQALSKYLPINADLKVVERFIYGQLLPLAFTRYEVVDTPLRIAEAVADQLSYRYVATVNEGNYTLQKSVLTDKLANRQLGTTFDGIESVDSLLFPMQRHMEIREGNNERKIEVEFSKVKVNPLLQFPFE